MDTTNITSNEKQRGINIIVVGSSDTVFVERLVKETQTSFYKLQDCFENFSTECTTTSYTITRLANSLNELECSIIESLNSMSLKRLKELMFVPVKIELPNYYFKNRKHIYIRNQLPIKIRKD